MITDGTRVKQYDIASPYTGPWTFTFKYWQKAEIVCTLSFPTIADVPMVLDTDYSLTAPGVGGTVARVSAWATKWAEAPIRLTIYRTLDYLQGSDYPGEPIPSARIEDDYDRAAARDAQLSESSSRNIQTPITDLPGVMVLPDKNARASKFVAFDAEGNVIASVGSGTPCTAAWAAVLDDLTISAGLTTMGFSEFIKTLIDDADAATARKTLGFNLAVLTSTPQTLAQFTEPLTIVQGNMATALAVDITAGADAVGKRVLIVNKGVGLLTLTATTGASTVGMPTGSAVMLLWDGAAWNYVSGNRFLWILTSGTTWKAPWTGRFDAVAGGGGGGGGSATYTTTNTRCGGGGGGGTARKRYSLVAGQTCTYAIGAGGAAATNGGDTTFTDGTTQITGGLGYGAVSISNGTEVAGMIGAGGAATSGDINIPGGSGSHPTSSPNTTARGYTSQGGASLMSFGGGASDVPSSQVADGMAAGGYGGGGGGGYAGVSGTGTGGAGSNGVVLLEVA